MNAIKSMAIIAVLAAAGIGLYLNFKSEPPEPPAGYTDGLDYVGGDIMAPKIEMPDEFETSANAGSGTTIPKTTMPSMMPTATAVPPLASPPGTSMPNTHAPNAHAETSASFAAPLQSPIALPSSSSTYSSTRQAAQALLDRGELAQSHRLLSHSYGDPTLSPAEQDELAALLGQLAGTVIYSRGHHLEPAHRVVAGETLETIANQYNVPWQLLAKINSLTGSAHVTVGQELKVVRGPFSAIVSIERRELTLMLAGCYAGRFAVGFGRDHEAIEGSWIVNQKQTNPTYYGASGMIDADNPANPLGEHMLGLVNPTAGVASKPFGIHGTHDPASIQSGDPRGFIRLAPQDAEDVFDILTIGSKVIIRR